MPFSNLSDTELTAKFQELSREASEVALLLESPAKARRRARNLILSATATIAGVAIGGVSGPVGFAIILPSIFVAIDNIVEDAQIHAQEMRAKARLRALKLLLETAEQEMIHRGFLP